MSIERVKPGDRFTPRASTWNAFADAADAHRATSPNGVPDAASRPWMVLVRNSGDDQLDRFDAVELGAPVIDDQANPDEFDRLSGFDVAYPTDPAIPGKMAIIQESISPGQTGRAIIFGVSPAREITIEIEEHTRAVAGAAGELVSADDGPAVILWRSPIGQATRRAVVALTQGSASTATRWARIISSTEIDSSNRWDYSIEFIRVGADGSWEIVPGSSVAPAKNTIEANNSSTGVQGNGVDADTLPDGFSIVPIGDGAVVRVSGPLGVIDGVDPGYWIFSIANLVDGECVSP